MGSITMTGVTTILILLVGFVFTPITPNSVNTLDSNPNKDTEEEIQCCGEGSCLCSCGPCHQHCCRNLRCHHNECIPESSCSKENHVQIPIGAARDLAALYPLSWLPSLPAINDF